MFSVHRSEYTLSTVFGEDKGTNLIIKVLGYKFSMVYGELMIQVCPRPSQGLFLGFPFVTFATVNVETSETTQKMRRESEGVPTLPLPS